MTVDELNEDQLYELTQRAETDVGRECTVEEVKDFWRKQNVNFVNDDFFCTAWHPSEEYNYAGRHLTVEEFEKDNGMEHIAAHHPDIVKAIEWARAKMLSYLADPKKGQDET